MPGLVVRGPRERGVHDDQIAGPVLDRDVVLAEAVRCRAAHGLARGEQGVGMVGIEKVERADVCPVSVDAVGHRVDPGFPVGERGVGAGQHGTGEMGGGRHDVQPGQNALNQGWMQVLVIASGPAVAPVHGTLRGGEQGSRAAGEVRDPQPFDRAPSDQSRSSRSTASSASRQADSGNV